MASIAALVKAPANAPNVLIVLIDDMGFGQSSAFRGPIHMPTVESLANSGLRYNEFHTTALCSPTRSALLSGRNHHMNNFGSIAETAVQTKPVLSGLAQRGKHSGEPTDDDGVGDVD
jgi:arylsulfatase A-like enzyme